MASGRRAAGARQVSSGAVASTLRRRVEQPTLPRLARSGSGGAALNNVALIELQRLAGNRATQYLVEPKRPDRLTAAKLRERSGKLAGRVQRLALRYGDKAPIPADAEKIAAAQNKTRVADISVQTIPGTVPDNVFQEMNDQERIYIVAHGRAPLGNEPAVLQEGDGDTLSGADVARIVSQIRTGLAAVNKPMGSVKIEACMSALSRKTKSGLFGEAFITASPSMLQDVQKSLAATYDVDDVELEGNLGFSTGTETDEGGVENLSASNTELGLLAGALEELLDVAADHWSDPDSVALKNDGLNVVRKFGAKLRKFDTDSQVSELISEATATVIRSYLNASPKASDSDNDISNIVTLLNGYIRGNPDD